MLFLETLHDNFTIMHGKFVCLSCLSHPSGAFCAARSWTPTAEFESLGLRYVEPHLVPYHPHGQSWGKQWLLPGNEPLKTLGKYKKKRKNVARIKKRKNVFLHLCRGGNEKRERKRRQKRTKDGGKTKRGKGKIMIWICPPLMCSQPSRSKDS